MRVLRRVVEYERGGGGGGGGGGWGYGLKRVNIGADS